MGRFSLVERKVLASVTLVAALVAPISVAGAPSTFDIDHAIYRHTVAQMASGAGYYEAMDIALTDRGFGPVASVRAYRMPTVFRLWVGIGTSVWVWLVYTGLLLGIAIWLGRTPLVVALIGLYLASNGIPFFQGGWHGQWLAVELWAAPWMVVTVAGWQADRDGAAAVLATVGAGVREHAVTLLAGGLAGSRRRRWWMAGMAVFAAGYALHWVAARPLLVPSGQEPPMFGWQGLGGVGRMAGMGLPLPELSGLLLLGAAWWAAVRSGWWLRVGPTLGLPLLGAVTVDRHYWGLMVVPVAVLAVMTPRRAGRPKRFPSRRR